MTIYFWKGQELSSKPDPIFNGEHGDNLNWQSSSTTFQISGKKGWGPYAYREEEAQVPISWSSTLISSVNDYKKCNWNDPNNWYIAVRGLNPNPDEGQFRDGNYYFQAATQAPGGGDVVYFDRYEWIVIEDGSPVLESYPKSDCLFGGYWNESSGYGWVNAANTGGKVNVIVNEGFGFNNTFPNTSASDEITQAGTARIGFDQGLFGFGDPLIYEISYMKDRYEQMAGIGTPPLGIDYGDTWDEDENPGPPPAGVTGNAVSGLRINANRFINKAQQRTRIALTESNIDNLYLQGKIQTAQFAGGNIQNITIDDTAFIPPGNDSFTVSSDPTLENPKSGSQIIFFPKYVRFNNPAQYYDPYMFGTADMNITGKVVVKSLGNAWNTKEFSLNEDWHYETGFGFGNIIPFGSLTVVGGPTSEIDSVLIDMDIRGSGRYNPSTAESLVKFDANINTFTAYPERRRLPSNSAFLNYEPILGGARYDRLPLTSITIQSVVDDYGLSQFGYSEGRTIKTLQLLDHPSPIRRCYTKDDVGEGKDWPSFIDPEEVVGINNSVGINDEITIEQANIYAGKLSLGIITSDPVGYQNTGVLNIFEYCASEGGETFQIEKGKMGVYGALDLRHPQDAYFKDVILGNGVSQPSEGTGVEIYNSDAVFKLPASSRIVLGHEFKDATFDTNQPFFGQNRG